MAEVNELLREHVLRTGFNLTLAKTQIAALVELHAAISRETWFRNSEISPTWRAFHASWVSGVSGLERRGLVKHVYHQNEPEYRGRPGEMPVSKAWEFTRAGELVIELLKEAGIYQHYAAAMPAEPVTADA